MHVCTHTFHIHHMHICKQRHTYMSMHTPIASNTQQQNIHLTCGQAYHAQTHTHTHFLLGTARTRIILQ